MARQPKPMPQALPDNFDHAQMESDIAKIDAFSQEVSQQESNANALARDLGYDGALTVGALEDEIRFFQRRTAEACLELGKRMLLLKELTPHGEFMQRVELLGFSDRSARRFMQAAFKFSKTANLANLAERIGTQAKLLELVTLDDSELVELADGKTVRGLELDNIDTMTYSELKAALREAKANESAHARLMDDKNKKLDTLEKQLIAKESRIAKQTPDEVVGSLRLEVSSEATAIEMAIHNNLIPAFRALTEHAIDNGGNHKEYMLGLLVQIELATARVREEFHFDKARPDADQTPVWMRPDADAVLAAAAANNYGASGEVEVLNG